MSHYTMNNKKKTAFLKRTIIAPELGLCDIEQAQKQQSQVEKTPYKNENIRIEPLGSCANCMPVASYAAYELTVDLHNQE